MRAEELDRLAVDGVVERGDPEDRALSPSGCAAAPPRLRVETPPGSREREVDAMSPVDDLPAVEVEAGLERLDVEKVCDGCGCQRPATISAWSRADVAGLRREARALPLPVVLGRRRNAVAVVALADHVRALERLERRLHFGQARVAVDARVQRGGDVLGRAVDALDVLEQADRLGDRLGERDASTSVLIASILPRISLAMFPETRS